tara:strand:+ start:1119 stop:1319 length:201 start_codon:yes stop_codon:yes gene_type:complete
MNRLNYNDWIDYIYNSVNKKDNPIMESRFGEVGKRTCTKIQEEINHLREIDKQISNRVRASYSLKK